VLLEKINSVENLRQLNTKELPVLAEEIRARIIEVISRNGGHLASSLGVVDLTIALHYVLDTPTDKIIWDVGHQSYAHKILTGRASAFHTIRTSGGISGFPRITESPFDTYNVGHSSTSLSLAIGECVARDYLKKDYCVVPVIGDGSLTGGMAFEALNQIGHLKRPMMIILNDNEHSISRNVGALSEYLTRIISGSFYNTTRKMIYDIIEHIPLVGAKVEELAAKGKSYLKGLLVPGKFFEDLGLRYFGPVNGHNIEAMVEIFSNTCVIKNGPIIVHVVTQKGRGYGYSERKPKHFHSVAPFCVETGEPVSEPALSLSEVAGKTLVRIAKSDDRVFAVTAAMTTGTGLEEFSLTFPRRCIDVGIAEQHAVTFSAALARNGIKPFCAIYSTFLQRAYDQIVHDVGSMKLPVRFLIDRAGIVGEDGETHHGLLDISYLKSIPGMMILSPPDGAHLVNMVYYAWKFEKGPVAIRYHKGNAGRSEYDFVPEDDYNPLIPLYDKRGSDVLLIAHGVMHSVARNAAEILAAKGVAVSTVCLLCVKPLDTAFLNDAVYAHRRVYVIENNYRIGGVGESILSDLSGENRGRLRTIFAFPDEFICHAPVSELFARYGLTAQQIAETILCDTTS